MMSHKKIHRFLITTLPACSVGSVITIEDERVAHQVHTVLRLQPNESITVFVDGEKNIVGTIQTLDKETITLEVTAIEDAPTIPRNIIAAVSIVKGDAFEWIVQKLTEIGVTTIVPLISSRTVKQNIRLERLQIISDEALEQCGGTKRVTITEPLSLQDCLTTYPFQTVVFDPLSTNAKVEQPEENIVCLVGPEGGWSEEDETIINTAQCYHVQLSNRVLRTETAAIVGVYTLLWE